MDLCFQIIIDKIDWLYSVLFEYKFFYLDLWSIVHVWSGAVIFSILAAYKVKRRWLILLILLTLFEVVENTFFVIVLNIFKPEKIVDVFNDIALGMLGGYLIYVFYKSDIAKKQKKLLPIFLSSITVAFIWVGGHGYNYTIAFFNSPFINWWALTTWTISGVTIIYLYNYFKNNIFKGKYLFFKSIVSSWLIYLALLFTLKHVVNNLLFLRELPQRGAPLVFDIIHGSPIKHYFYILAPLLFIGLFIMFERLFTKFEYVYNR